MGFVLLCTAHFMKLHYFEIDCRRYHHCQLMKQYQVCYFYYLYVYILKISQDLKFILYGVEMNGFVEKINEEENELIFSFCAGFFLFVSY